MLGCVGAPRGVILPQPFHHVLDPPDLLLDLTTEHLILKQPQSGSRMGQPFPKPGPPAQEALEPHAPSCTYAPRVDNFLMGRLFNIKYVHRKIKAPETRRGAPTEPSWGIRRYVLFCSSWGKISSAFFF